jgi:hypothetical protein
MTAHPEQAKVLAMPMKRERAHHCWVIKWQEDERYPFTKNFLHVLPWRWTSSHVLEHVLSLYHNSPALMIFERASWMNSKPRYGIFIRNEGSRIIVGDHPFFLMGCRVKDFCVVREPEKRVEVVSYTQPQGFRWNPKVSEMERIGSAVQVRVEMKY